MIAEPETPTPGGRPQSGDGPRLVARIVLFLVVLPTVVILAVKWAFGV